MYESYWDLPEKLFENTPDPRFLFQDDRTSDVFARLLYTMRANRDGALLTGKSGGGKTLLTRALLQELDPENTETAEGFLRDILIDLRGKRPDEPAHIDLEEEPIPYIIDPAIEEGVRESAPA